MRSVRQLGHRLVRRQGRPQRQALPLPHRAEHGRGLGLDGGDDVRPPRWNRPRPTPPPPGTIAPEAVYLSRRERRLLAEVHETIAAGTRRGPASDGPVELIYQPPSARTEGTTGRSTSSGPASGRASRSANRVS